MKILTSSRDTRYTEDVTEVTFTTTLTTTTTTTAIKFLLSSLRRRKSTHGKTSLTGLYFLDKYETLL